MIPSLSVSVSLRRVSQIIEPLETLPPGVWGQALHDYETPEYFRPDLGYSVPRSIANPDDRLKDAKGYPEMVPGNPRVGVKLTKPLQWYWVKLLVWGKYRIELVEYPGTSIEAEFRKILSRSQQDYIKNAWRGLTKSFTAFTNQRGTDNCRDYINGVNLGEDEDPMLWENTTGGSLLRLESTQVYRQGYKILALRVADYNLWKNWTPDSHPGYFTDATNSTPFGFDGTPTLRGPWRVDRFHYLGGSPVFVPIISNTGYFYIKTNRIRILKEGERFPPRVTNP